MVNDSALPYDTQQNIAGFGDLARVSNEFMEGGLAIGLTALIWIIAFNYLSQQGTPRNNAILGATFAGFTFSSLLYILQIADAAIVLLMLGVLAGMTALGYASKSR